MKIRQAEETPFETLLPRNNFLASKPQKPLFFLFEGILQFFRSGEHFWKWRKTRLFWELKKVISLQNKGGFVFAYLKWMNKNAVIQCRSLVLGYKNQDQTLLSCRKSNPPFSLKTKIPYSFYTLCLSTTPISSLQCLYQKM